MTQATGQFDQLSGRDPERHLVHPRVPHMATYGQEFQATGAILALRRPPRPALEYDTGDHGKGFHIINQCRCAKQPVGTGKGRFVTRLSTFIFERFEQSGLFAADVASWAFEDFEIYVTEDAPDLIV